MKLDSGRIAHRTRIVSAIAQRVAEKTAAEWIGALHAAGIPCGIVKTVSEALEGVGASAASGIPSPLGGETRLDPLLLDADGEAVRKLGWRAFDTR